MKRLGLVGTGAWGHRYIESVERRKDCRLVAVVRRSADPDASFPQLTVVRDWRDLLELVRRGELDGVVVATTPENQAEIALEAVRQSIPILVEKPLGLSPQAPREVRAVLEANERPAPVLVDTIHLWSHAYVELKARVRSAGGPSRVATIKTRGANRGPFRSWPALYDYGVHDVSMCLDLLEPSASVRVLGARKRAKLVGIHRAESYQADLQVAGTRIDFSVDNGSELKVRRFAVELVTGRTLVYDDVEPPERKLLDCGEPVSLPNSLPLDAVLSDFLGRIERFQTGQLSRADVAQSVVLAERALTVLEDIDGAAGTLQAN